MWYGWGRINFSAAAAAAVANPAGALRHSPDQRPILRHHQFSTRPELYAVADPGTLLPAMDAGSPTQFCPQTTARFSWPIPRRRPSGASIASESRPLEGCLRTFQKQNCQTTSARPTLKNPVRHRLDAGQGRISMGPTFHGAPVPASPKRLHLMLASRMIKRKRETGERSKGSAERLSGFGKYEKRR